VIAFARTDDGTLKGSGRSIEGVHIRDVLDSVAKRHPNLIEKFGGHAMAAGLSLLEKDFKDFSIAFDEALSAVISEDLLHKELVTDGELLDEDFSVRTAELLNEGGPWGQGFPEPLFDGVFDIIEQRLVGERHLKLSLRRPEGKRVINAIAFNVDTKAWPNHHCTQVKIVYRLDINEYQTLKNIQLLIEYIEII
jgi:single-stranded-DNA-specific exonuclease